MTDTGFSWFAERDFTDRSRRASIAVAGVLALMVSPWQRDVEAQPTPALSTGTVIGDPEEGKRFWETLATSSCKNCHGIQGQGGFAPALAGRGLTTEDFVRAITQPAIMPEFPQYNVQHMANFAAHFARLPPVTTQAPWRYAMPADAGPGLMVAFAIGCAQCHGPELETPRHNAGAVFADADFEWFKTHVYEHTSVVRDHWALLGLPSPPPWERMGDYSTDRLPESVLAQIWGWMTEEGLLTPVTASLPKPERTVDGVHYTLTLLNQGLPGKGLVAENVQIRLMLPAGATVVNATGEGYKGVERDAQTQGNVAAWQVARIAPQDRPQFQLTLANLADAEDTLRGAATWQGQDTKHPEVLNLRVGQRPRSFP
jgi:mono/diheme cytochrome c family protein